MAEILQFKRSTAKQKNSKQQAAKKGLGMCQHGFHKWKVWKKKQFDVKEGKLVTVYRCERCGAQTVKAH